MDEQDTTPGQSELDQTPTDSAAWARHWNIEFSAAKDELKPWHKEANEAVRAFLTEKYKDQDAKPLGFFTSDVLTMEAMLFGRTPHTDVTRKFGDFMDDTARVAATMLERTLNGDLEFGAHGGAAELRNVLKDRLVAGFGMPRLRLVTEYKDNEVAAIVKKDEFGADVMDEGTGKPVELAPSYKETVKSYECVETLYNHWKDMLWSPSRTFEEVRWFAFKEPMTRKEQVKRFGSIGKLTPLNGKKGGKSAFGELKDNDPLKKSDVWEIWSKEHGKVFWYVDGFDRILDQKDDPLGLDNFWPFPRPFVAVMSTDKFLPVPDYKVAKELYVQCDELALRIFELEDSIGVKGAYDASLGDELRQMVEERGNKLYAVHNFAMLGEKGGVGKIIDWYPLETIVAALVQLKQALSDKLQLLYQVTGKSDIMRGQAQEPGATATEQMIKGKFASVRLQALQDEFARLCSETQRIKAEIICKHFDPQTIIQCSNILQTPDAPLAQQAVALLQDEWATYRIEVKPESVSAQDYSALKAERADVLTSLGSFFQSMTPLIQLAGPGAAGFAMELAQWMLAGIKGASTMEGMFEQAIKQAKAAAQQPQAGAPQQPDPKLIANQQKAQADMQKIQAQQQSELVRMQAETQQLAQRRMTDAVINVKEAQAKKAINGGGLAIPGQVPEVAP